jgi:hypothetical protein
MLGQLLRKFLESNFRRMHYELHVINSTLSDLSDAQRNATMTQEEMNKQQMDLSENQGVMSNLTEKHYTELVSSITQLQGSMDMIKIVMPQIGEIKKAVSEFTTLKNITADIRQLREEILSDSKRHIEGLVRLIRMSYSNAIRVMKISQSNTYYY